MVCGLTIIALTGLAAAQAQAPAPAPPLRQTQTIALPDVRGRIDHMAIDRESQRLFIAALGNGSVDVVDLATGKAIARIGDLPEPQGIAYLPDMKMVIVSCGADGTC